MGIETMNTSTAAASPFVSILKLACLFVDLDCEMCKRNEDPFSCVLNAKSYKNDVEYVLSTLKQMMNHQGIIWISSRQDGRHGCHCIIVDTRLRLLSLSKTLNTLLFQLRRNEALKSSYPYDKGLLFDIHAFEIRAGERCWDDNSEYGWTTTTTTFTGNKWKTRRHVNHTMRKSPRPRRWLLRLGTRDVVELGRSVHPTRPPHWMIPSSSSSSSSLSSRKTRSRRIFVSSRNLSKCIDSVILKTGATYYDGLTNSRTICEFVRDVFLLDIDRYFVICLATRFIALLRRMSTRKKTK